MKDRNEIGNQTQADGQALARRCSEALEQIFQQSPEDYEAEVARINRLEGWADTHNAFRHVVRPKLFTGDPANKMRGEYALIISINHRFDPNADKKRLMEYRALSVGARSAYETASNYFVEDYYYAPFFDRVASLLRPTWGTGVSDRTLMNERALCVELHPYWSSQSAYASRTAEWHARAQTIAEELLRWVLTQCPPAIVISMSNASGRLGALGPRGFEPRGEGYRGGSRWMHKAVVGMVGDVPALAVAFDYSPADYRVAAADLVRRLAGRLEGPIDALAAAGFGPPLGGEGGEGGGGAGGRCPYTTQARRDANRPYLARGRASVGWRKSRDLYFYDMEAHGPRRIRRFHVVLDVAGPVTGSLQTAMDEARGGGPGACPVEGAPPCRLMKWTESSEVFRFGFAWEHSTHPSEELVGECWDWLQTAARALR